jgi:hypothetical protein
MTAEIHNSASCAANRTSHPNAIFSTKPEFSFPKSNLVVRDDFRLTLEGIPHLSFMVQSAARGPGNIGTRIRVLLLADPCRWLTVSCAGKYARMHQVAVRPANKEPDDDDEIICGGAADRAVPRNVGSGANQRKHGAAAGLRDRPRGRGAALERRVHDRSGSKPVR